MQYKLIGNRWAISWRDSAGSEMTFWHPTSRNNVELYVANSGTEAMTTVSITEETLQEIFPSDAVTETIVAHMKQHEIKFDDGLDPWTNDA